MIRFLSKTGSMLQEIAWYDAEAIFAKIANQDGAVWLDGQSNHPLARTSFICHAPFQPIAEPTDMALSALESSLQRYEDPWPDLPSDISASLPNFRGGFVGVFSYELGGAIESLPDMPPYRLGEATIAPLAGGLYSDLLAFNHQTRQCFILATGLPADGGAARRQRAEAQIAKWQALITSADAVDDLPPPPQVTMRSNFTGQSYQMAVENIIEHICAGDIFQANLSQSFDGRFLKPYAPFDLYRRLRALSPAPFSGFLQFADWALLSSSPERFLETDGRTISARPIKGTRPRQSRPDADAAEAAQLLASPKDRAENIMIVDLLRNDLARICEDRSIAVPDLCILESHSQVHHLVSTIAGRLRADASVIDILRASFPGGSITGAPKIRAMEIIAQYEGAPRGPYCGSLGYIGFDGRLDLNILIRSLVMAQDAFRFQVGGGITARSEPAREFRETLDKAAGLLAALGVDLPYRKRFAP